MALDVESLIVAGVALACAGGALGIAVTMSGKLGEARRTIHRLQQEKAKAEAAVPTGQRRIDPGTADVRSFFSSVSDAASFPGLFFFWPNRDSAPQVAGRADVIGLDALSADRDGAVFWPHLLSRLHGQDRQDIENALALVWDRKLPVSGRLERQRQDGLAYNVFCDGAGVSLLITSTGQIGRQVGDNQFLLETVPYPIWKTDVSGRLVWINNAYMEAVDAVSSLTVLNEQRHLIEDIPPNVLAERPDDGTEGVATRRMRRGVGIMAGERRMLEVTSLWFGDTILHIAVDRSEQDSLRRELARQDLAHREVLNALTTAVAVTGRDQRLVYHNDAFARLWGLSDSFLETSPSHREIMDELRRLRRLPEKADFKGWLAGQLGLYTSPDRSFEDMWHLPDNKTLRVVSTQHPLGGLLILYEDVTDQFAMERSYNTLIGVQRASLDNLYEGVAVFGADGRLQLYNAAYERIYQTGQSVIRAGTLFDDIATHARDETGLQTDWEELKAYIARDKAENRPKTGRMLRDDDLIVDYAAVPLPDGATLLTHLDVTDASRMQMALQQRNDALEAADRLKSEFLTHISYQLRTPLNSILGFSEMLVQDYAGPLNQRQNEYVSGILDSSHQLIRLIDDILDLSAVQDGELALDITRFDLAEVLQSIIDIHVPRAQEKGLRFTWDLDSSLGEIEADEVRVKQILANLLSNSFKYTYPGDAVTVTGRGNEDEVVVVVEDSGMGIPAEYQSNIFEHFEALDRDARKRGAGLGLSMVRSFVELHGGRIEMESELDKGTKLAFYLPRRFVASEEPESEPGILIPVI